MRHKEVRFVSVFSANIFMWQTPPGSFKNNPPKKQFSRVQRCETSVVFLLRINNAATTIFFKVERYFHIEKWSVLWSICFWVSASIKSPRLDLWSDTPTGWVPSSSPLLSFLVVSLVLFVLSFFQKVHGNNNNVSWSLTTMEMLKKVCLNNI